MDFNSIPNELREKTDAELAVILPSLTARNIPKLDAISWLSSNGFARRDPFEPTKSYYGTLVDLAVSDTIPPPLNQSQFDSLKAGLKHFFGYLLEKGDTLTTGSINEGPEPYAVQYKRLLDTLVLVGAVTSEQVESFYSLGGGRQWKDEDETTIAAARAAYQQQLDDEAAEAVLDGYKSHIINEFINSATSKVELETNLPLALAWLQSQG